MTKRERMRILYEKADNVKPFAEKDGQVYVSFEDASVLNSVNAEEPSGNVIKIFLTLFLPVIT